MENIINAINAEIKKFNVFDMDEQENLKFDALIVARNALEFANNNNSAMVDALITIATLPYQKSMQNK